jgi:leucyl/phenylalanyl-tRNA--protein transferase
MGFAVLNYHLAKWGYVLNDGKGHTPTIEAMGFRLIPRAEYEAILKEHANASERENPWVVEADLASISKWQSASELDQNKKQAA